MRLGRNKAVIGHILLLPAGLAAGLGQEVSCPTAYADSPRKIGSPASPADGPENSAFGLMVQGQLTFFTPFHRDVNRN